MAGCQGWEHIEPCLKPGRAPSTGAERGCVKGYKKRRHADTSRGADCANHYNPVFVLDRKLPARLSHLEAAEKVSFVSCWCHKPD